MESMSMSMSMPMASATSSGMGSMATSGSMSGMNMSGMDMGMMMDMMAGMTMSMSQMNMTFFAADNTPLYSNAWTPRSTGQYAGTCIFLIALSVLLRLMYGLKCMLEAHWARTAAQHRYIVTAPPHRDSVAAHQRPGSGSSSDEAATVLKGSHAVIGTLTVAGKAEEVRIVHPAAPLPDTALRALAPFKLNTDLPRALFVTVMLGVAYLLMLAVMTMNVGYFLSVLAGAFLGELLFGRWAIHSQIDHH